MEKMDKLGYDLALIIETFSINVPDESTLLNDWLAADYTLNQFEQWLFDRVYARTRIDGGYWNEEELKIKFVGSVFDLADVDTKDKIKVFYERPFAATVEGYALSVVTDCMIAKPLPFNKPQKPYFFFQEFKKKRGEKNDPEAQMLTAMLIAQEMNQDNQPIYGGFLFGPYWQFAILDDRTYINSRDFNATNADDLRSIIYILRKLKDLILSR